ncbi:hypothetical protein SLOPH_1120, partial [Spraguea lophii 42_110]
KIIYVLIYGYLQKQLKFKNNNSSNGIGKIKEISEEMDNEQIKSNDKNTIEDTYKIRMEILKNLKLVVSKDIFKFFCCLFPYSKISSDPNDDNDLVIIYTGVNCIKEFRHINVDFTLNISNCIINLRKKNKENILDKNEFKNIEYNGILSQLFTNNIIQLYFIPIDNILSMERSLFTTLFIEDNYQLLNFELFKFFKKFIISEIYCKGKIATDLGEQLNKYNKSKPKFSKNSKEIRRLVIFDRTEDIITPLSFNLEPMENLLDLCKTEEDFIDKINIKSELEILSEYILFNINNNHSKFSTGHYENLKRELIYTYGPKLLKFFNNVSKIRKRRPIFLPDLCKAVRRQDIDNYKFDRIFYQNKNMMQSKSENKNMEKREMEDVVLFIGGVCKKEISKLKKFQILTTEIIDKKSFIEQLMQ